MAYHVVGHGLTDWLVGGVVYSMCTTLRCISRAKRWGMLCGVRGCSLGTMDGWVGAWVRDDTCDFHAVD